MSYQARILESIFIKVNDCFDTQALAVRGGVLAVGSDDLGAVGGDMSGLAVDVGSEVRVNDVVVDPGGDRPLTRGEGHPSHVLASLQAELAAAVLVVGILAVVRTHEPAATSEVADAVDMTRQGADRRLRQLHITGRVNSKKIGASLVWFSADDSDSDND